MDPIANKPAPPPIATTFHRVTKDQFFTALIADKRDIMPLIDSGWDSATGYVQVWRSQGVRALFGVTDGGTHLCASRYWLVCVPDPTP